jgi:phosphoribosylanthranilate isomerase
MDTRVKICGITRLPDALAAVEAGADALGFMFYEASPRHVTFHAAAEIIRQLPSEPLKVGVFVNAPEDTVLRAIQECALTMLQFHGDEPPAFCTQFGLMSMKAFRVHGPESIKALTEYRTDAWLLDAHAPGKLGGTGETFDWKIASDAVRLGRPVFLAGGLTPANVGEAIRTVRPFGVDVSSGVESAPGRKDAGKIREFIAAAKRAGQAVAPG